MQARRVGVKTVLCTGRATVAIEKYLQLLDLRNEGDYVITYNGSAVVDTYNNTPIFMKGLKAEYVKELFDLLKHFDVNVYIYIGDSIYVGKITKRVNYEHKSLNMETVQIDRFEEIKDKDVIKIIFYGDIEKLKKVKEFADNRYKGKMNVFFSKPFYLEFTNAEANKGLALAVLAKHLGIAKDEIIAMGDGFNDVYMFEVAGIGVAVANSCDEVKNVVDYVTRGTNNESPASEVINKFIL